MFKILTYVGVFLGGFTLLSLVEFLDGFFHHVGPEVSFKVWYVGDTGDTFLRTVFKYILQK